jgi:hypothetical protein
MARLISVLPRDYIEIAEFLSQYEGWSETAEFWLDEFHVWWDENPFLSDGMERGWILREEQKVVGFIGVTPSPFQLFGVETIVFNGTAGYVLPKYRNQSLQLFTKFISYAKDSILFNSQPSDKVVKIIRKLRFNPIPRSTCKQSLIFFNFEKILKVKLGQTILTKTLIKVISPLLAMIQSMRLKKPDIEDMNNIKRVREADSTFDELWERTKHIYPNTNVRNSKTINWQCFKNKRKEKVVLGYYQKDQLLGYVICKDARMQDVRIFECTDYWVCPHSDQVMNALINAVHFYALEESYDCVLLPHFNLQLENICHERGLFSMANKNRREYFKVKPEWYEKINESNSYFVAQGDRAL